MGKAAGALFAPVLSLLGGSEVPQPKKAPVMPTADEERLAEARKRQATEAQQRSGRVSTILSRDSGLFSSEKV